MHLRSFPGPLGGPGGELRTMGSPDPHRRDLAEVQTSRRPACPGDHEFTLNQPLRASLTTCGSHRYCGLPHAKAPRRAFTPTSGGV